MELRAQATPIAGHNFEPLASRQFAAHFFEGFEVALLSNAGTVNEDKCRHVDFLDEESIIPKGNDLSFFSKISDQLSGHAHLELPSQTDLNDAKHPKDLHIFTIKHCEPTTMPWLGPPPALQARSAQFQSVWPPRQ